MVLPEQSPFPSRGRVLAFHGALHGRQVVFAHIFGTEPLPQSRVLAFELGLGRASFGFEDGRVLTSTLIRTCRVKRS